MDRGADKGGVLLVPGGSGGDLETGHTPGRRRWSTRYLSPLQGSVIQAFQKLKTPAESVQMVAQLKQTSAETCLDFYDRCTNSIHEAHEEDLRDLANQPEARDGYQRAIKLTIRQHFVAGLHTDIKAQISAKLQSLNTKEKLLTAAAEIEAAVRPKNAAAALMAVDHIPAAEAETMRDMQRVIDAIRS